MNEYAGRPFQALAIDLWNGSEAAIDAFVNATGITYPILLKGGEAGVNIDYGCYADDFFVVGPEGEILVMTANGGIFGIEKQTTASRPRKSRKPLLCVIGR